MKKPTSVHELAFESKDTEIFKIKDLHTRIDTLQNYFFPRLEILLRDSIDLIQEIYQVDPMDRMTFVFRPNNRRNAVQPVCIDEVYVGLSAKRLLDRYSGIRHDDGSPHTYHPAYLKFVVEPLGTIRAMLSPYHYRVDRDFMHRVNETLSQRYGQIEPILSMNHVAHSSALDFVRISEAFEPDTVAEHGVHLTSAPIYFPADYTSGLFEIQMAFVALYPLLDTLVCLGEETPIRLVELLESYRVWWQDVYLSDAQPTFEEGVVPDMENDSIDVLPDLDGYTYVRPGRWYTVLARDKWSCRSCGRSTKEHGIILHVDHILPRSKGGSDNIDNLQTLCMKCNLGKSNRDNTDLRLDSNSVIADTQL